MSKWKQHLLKVGSVTLQLDQAPTVPSDIQNHRRKIEPWLSAILQSEHLSLLLGSGFTTAISTKAKVSPLSMSKVNFGCPLENEVNEFAEKSAKACGRGVANIEDQIRSAISLINGLEILKDAKEAVWKRKLNEILLSFLHEILKIEKGILNIINGTSEAGADVKRLLISFLLSFASRAATRERLHVFTSNYDRLIEFGCDLIGLRVVDRFVGALSPRFRSARTEVDLHYNPPGIRGEPRYLEGVIKLTKLHGSIDWRYSNNEICKNPLSFGASADHSEVGDPYGSLIIYPNPAKDIETLEYPYAELFRDYASALCRPNSVLLTYGYGFGDDHINRIIADMLTIPSTHLVIMSYDEAGGRIPFFCKKVGREAQLSLLIGNHFGDLETLVQNYLPKPTIDQISWRKADLLRKRGVDFVRDEDIPAESPVAMPETEEMADPST